MPRSESSKRTRSRATRSKRTSVPRFEPLTPDRWPDLEQLFGERGACGGCWCMWWRLPRSVFNENKGAANKRALKKIVTAGPPPGILSYVDGRPVGWCAVGPRESYPSLERSRTLKRIDDQPAWAITCFFIDKAFRRKGLSSSLIEAAVKFAAKSGAKLIEGYPVEPKKNDMPDPFAWTGVRSAFHKAGFVEALRRSPTRPIMRCIISSEPRRD